MEKLINELLRHFISRLADEDARIQDVLDNIDTDAVIEDVTSDMLDIVDGYIESLGSEGDED